MRHSYFGKKLSRTNDERKQLFRNLVRSLFLHGSIITTKAKAKAIQSMAEKLITKAKKQTEEKKREALAILPYKDVVKQLWSDANTRFAERTSGYTRIIKIGERRGDATEEVKISLVDEILKTDVMIPKIAKTVESVTSEKQTVEKKKSTQKKKTS